MRWRKNLIFLILLLGIMALCVLFADWWAYKQLLAIAAVQGVQVLEDFMPFQLTDSVWGIVLVAFVSAIKELVDLPSNGHNGHPPPEVNAKLDELEKAIEAKEKGE